MVLGAVIPVLGKTGALGFTDRSLTLVATIGLVGVGIGAVLIGPLTDRFGRRRSLISCIAVFSVCTLLVAVAPSITVFAVLRFVAGLGLVACLPTALAFMTEYAPSGRGGSAVTRTMTGYHVGAVLTALLALVLVEPLGWQAMFVVGGVAGLLVAGLISDARGNKPTVLVWFALAAVFLVGLSVRLESTVAVYVAVFLAGVFVFSAQVLVYAFVGTCTRRTSGPAHASSDVRAAA